MNSKSYEIVKELISLHDSGIFLGLKKQSIFEEAGVISSSETEKKVYMNDMHLLSSGYKFILSLGRAAFTNDDGTIDNKRFLLISIFNFIQDLHNTNCVHIGIHELVETIIKCVLIDKYDKYNTIEDYNDVCGEKFLYAFGRTYEAIMIECRELTKKYKSMNKFEAFNYAIDRNFEFIKFANSVLPEDDRVAPVEFLSSQIVTDEERNNVKDGYSKCMSNLLINLKKSLKKEKK